MWTFFVEVAQVVGDSLSGFGHCFVGAPVDFFLLEAAPEALHVHVVEPAALTIHRDAHAVRLERTGERLGGKLRSLVRIEDLWGAVADNGFFHRFDAKGCVHRVREPVGEHLAAMPVDYGHEIEKAFRHKDVRNVRRIDLAGSRHLRASEKVGVNLVPLFPETTYGASGRWP